MKKLLNTFIFLYSLTIFSQINIPNLELKKDGIEPIIILVDSTKSKKILYDKTKEWIQLNYNDPTKVLKGDIKDSNIRINGFKKYAWKEKKFNYDIDYSIIVDFKDGKYKFTYSVNEFILSDGGKCFFGVTDFFDKDGKRKEKAGNAIESINKIMNDLSKSLYVYIMGLNKEEW